MTKINKKNKKSNTIIMKILLVLGVVVFFASLIYLMDYFFIKKSYIKVNMSTDKKLEYITLKGEEELISTQKYVSDLGYTMRYDIEKFRVFKHKNQDIYKYLLDERVIVMVEKSNSPVLCSSSNLDNDYNNCYIKVDDYSEEYYISSNGKTYKILVKTPKSSEYDEVAKSSVNYMLNSFSISM